MSSAFVTSLRSLLSLSTESNTARTWQVKGIEGSAGFNLEICNGQQQLVKLVPLTLDRREQSNSRVAPVGAKQQMLETNV